MILKYLVPPDIVPLFFMLTIKLQCIEESDIRLYKMGFLIICVNLIGQSQSMSRLLAVDWLGIAKRLSMTNTANVLDR